MDLDVPLQKQKCYKITSVWTKLMFRNRKRLRDVMQLHLCHAAHEWMSQLGLFTSSDSPPHDLYVRSGLARFVLWRIPLKRVRWENTISIREDRMGMTSIPCCFYLKHEWVLYVKGVTLTHTWRASLAYNNGVRGLRMLTVCLSLLWMENRMFSDGGRCVSLTVL